MTQLSTESPAPQLALLQAGLQLAGATTACLAHRLGAKLLLLLGTQNK